MLAISARAKTKFKFDWNSRRLSFGEKLFKSLEYLSFKIKNRDAETACAYVEKIVAERDKHRLFQKFFPAEWQKSTASFFKPGCYANYSERINKFFELVNENLFPLLTGWNEDRETDFENFCIWSLNLDLCCEDADYERLRVSYSAGLLFYFRDEEIWDFLFRRFRISKTDFPLINDRPHDELWHLEKTGDERLYLLLFELIDHSTGNPWLDTSNCCHYGDFYGWDEETIVELARAFEEAKIYLDEIDELDRMFEAAPQQTLANLIALWNDGSLPPAADEKTGG